MASRWSAKKGVTAIIFLAVIGGSILLGLRISNYFKFEPSIRIGIDTNPYVLAEERSTHLSSRKWVSHAIEIAKKEKLSPPAAGRFIAYTASIYADVLEKTKDSTTASLATSRLMNDFFPKYNKEINDILSSKTDTFPEEAEKILHEYLIRSKTDGYDLIWDKHIPKESKWYISDNNIDSGAMAKNWRTWIVDKDIIAIPRPPLENSLQDKLELKKSVFFTLNRSFDDEETIFFWEGVDNFYHVETITIPIAGIWQNILAAEFGNEAGDNESYARYQKIISQAIADALIITWKAKYTFFTQRPSMKIPNLDRTISNPPFPAYVSENASVSKTASLVLTAIFPDRKEFLEHLAQSAAYAQVFAGTQFEADVVGGQAIGDQIGRLTIEKFFSGKKLPTTKNQSEFGAKLLVLKDYISLFLNPPRKKDSPVSPAFIDVGVESGLGERLEAGAAWGDVNNDGYLDLLTAGGLFINTGDGKFVRSNRTGIINSKGFFGDYNNDGCADIYEVRSGPLETLDSKGNSDSLFRGNCDGTFTDVSKQAGIRDEYHGVSASWVDYNNDGCLDIYVVNLGVMLSLDFDSPTTPYKFEPNILYKNNCDGTFTDVTNQAGVSGLIDCDVYRKDAFAMRKSVKIPFQPVWFDYNNDGWPDLLVVNDTFMSPLYKNKRDGTFTQVTKQAGLCASGRDSNMGAAIGDYFNNGFLDIYINDNGDNYLWKNNGDGTFTNIVNEAKANSLGYGWGTEALDYDNDGNLDILVVNGNNRIPSKQYYVNNMKHNDLDDLLRNNGDGTFTSVGQQEGVSYVNEVKFSAAVADYNNDGFPDIFIPTRGERHATHVSMLYKNQPNGNHWLTVQLVGTKSNRDAVGARITLTTGGKKQTRELISGSSYVSQSSPWPTFGLGKNTKIDTLEIRWPSGINQRLSTVPIDKKIIIKEADSTIYTSLKQLSK